MIMLRCTISSRFGFPPVGYCAQSARITSGEDQIGAAICPFLGQGGTDAARCAGDPCGLSFETHCPSNSCVRGM